MSNCVHGVMHCSVNTFEEASADRVAREFFMTGLETWTLVLGT